MRAFTRKDIDKQRATSSDDAAGDGGEIVSGPRKMAGAAEPRMDVDRELAEIRKEVIESRNLVIKTDNLLKSLHAEVKGVGKRQEDFERRQWFSSAGAYTLFVVVVVAASLVVAAVRGSAAKSEKARLQKSIDELTAKLEKENGERQLVQSASRSAADAYRQMTTAQGDDRLKGADALAKVDVSRLSPLERQAATDRANEARKEIGQESLERGKAAFRKSDMKTATRELGRFLAMSPPDDEAVEASYYLGVAYNLSKRYDEAVPLLARFVAEDKKAKSRDYAMLLLAHSYEQTGELDKAAQTVREALSAYPHSDFGNQFRTRLHAILRAAAGAAERGEAAQDGKGPARNGTEAAQAAAGETAGR